MNTHLCINDMPSHCHKQPCCFEARVYHISRVRSVRVAIRSSSREDPASASLDGILETREPIALHRPCSCAEFAFANSHIIYKPSCFDMQLPL